MKKDFIKSLNIKHLIIKLFEVRSILKMRIDVGEIVKGRGELCVYEINED